MKPPPAAAPDQASGDAPHLAIPWRHYGPAVLLALGLLWFWSSGVKNAMTWGAFLWVLYLAARHRRRPDLAGLGPAVALYLGACLLSACFSIDPGHSFRNLVKLLELMAGFVALAHLLRPRHRAWIAVAAVAGAMGILWFADSIKLLHDLAVAAPFEQDGRWIGSLYGYPTIAAGTYAPGFVFCAAVFLHARRPGLRLLLLLAMAICAVLLLMLQARSVFLAIPAGLAVVYLTAAMPTRRRLAVMALGLLLLFAGALGSPSFRAKWQSASASDRVGLWQDAWRLYRAHPVLGYGYGHALFEKAHRSIPGYRRRAARIYDHTHNMLLERLLQTGAVGLAAWLVFLGCAGYRAVRGFPPRTDPPARAAASAAAGALVTLLVYGQLSLFFALTPIFLFWSLLGLLMAAAWRRNPCA